MITVILVSSSAFSKSDSTPKWDAFAGYQYLYPGSSVPAPGGDPSSPTPFKLPGMAKGIGGAFIGAGGGGRTRGQSLSDIAEKRQDRRRRYSSKAVTVTNSGSATLDITSIATSGDFAIKAFKATKTATPCGSTLAAGASCVVKVTFTPTQTGTRTGDLTFTDNAPSSPQQVTLTGKGE